MKIVPINELFDVKYGNSLELINLEECSQIEIDTVNFVSRTEKNNGVSAFVVRNLEIPPNPSNTISVAVGGSVLSTFLQLQPYYTGFHVLVLHPKRQMSQIELLFYCYCIRKNKYRYNYGRQANKTLKDILVPSEMPKEFEDISLKKVNTLKSDCINNQTMNLDIITWQWYLYKDLFEIKKGKRIVNADMEPGTTPCIRPIEYKNGVHDYIDIEPNHKGNSITVNYNGSVAQAFYQPVDYFALDDVNVLYPKFELNQYIALFFTTLIRREKYRYNYGRKWHLERMQESKILLPTRNNKPDFEFMENFMKSLPYSSTLEKK